MPYGATFDPTLPVPTAADIDDRRTEDQAFWACRFCGLTEFGPLTTNAETRRSAAHEYQCPKRPADDIPWQHERAAYQAVHAAGLRRDLNMLAEQINDRRALLSRTWFFKFSGRRAQRDAIDELSCLIAGIHAHALTLGLDDGWDDQHFRPSALR